MQRPPWPHGPRWIWDFGLLVEKSTAGSGDGVIGAETSTLYFGSVVSCNSWPRNWIDGKLCPAKKAAILGYF